MSGLEVLVCETGETAVPGRHGGRARRALPEEAVFLGEEDGGALFVADLGRAARAAPAGSLSCAPSAHCCPPPRPAGAPMPGALALLAQPAPLLRCLRGRQPVAIQGGHVRRCQICDAPALSAQRSCGDRAGDLPSPESARAACSAARPSASRPACTRRLPASSSPASRSRRRWQREVFEEAGVELTDIAYRSSQPWPFPASLMLGFRARREKRSAAHRPQRAGRCRLVHPRGSWRIPSAGR